MGEWTLAAGVLFKDGRHVPWVDVLRILDSHGPMLEALRKHGTHTIACCHKSADGSRWKCNCGYSAAIKAAEGGSGGE